MPDPDTLTVYDSRGRPRQLVRLGSIPVPRGDEDEDEFDDDAPLIRLGGMNRVGAMGMDRTGAVITVQHTLDPEAAAAIQSLRKGAPVAAAIGGALAGAGLVLLLVWLASNRK